MKTPVEGERKTGSQTKKILVVEDDWSVVKFVQAHLGMEGYEVEIAGNVGEAWRIMQSDRLDLIIVDLRLPGVFGWELVERIRADNRFHRMPVLIASGFFESSDVDKAGSLGADTIAKPFLGPDLISKVKGLLNESQRIEMRSIKATLLLDAYLINGTIHVPPEVNRFSEAWECVVRDQRAFVPVTDATVTTLDGTFVAQTSFMQVTKAQLRGVFPLEENQVDLAPQVINPVIDTDEPKVSRRIVTEGAHGAHLGS